jgi:Na+-transporting NADH:ubiquinone oxidoreductase subunit A
MTKATVIQLRKGFDIRLEGTARKTIVQTPLSVSVDVKPTDFKYLIPKLSVEQGDEVEAGQPLFYHKDYPAIQFCAPVSGIVAEVVRGEKRRILAVRIHADKKGIQYKSFPKNNPTQLPSDQVRQRLLDGGCWAYIKQRPYDCIADPAGAPKAIFISCFDSAPLAPDISFIIEQEVQNFQTGLLALQRAGNCPVHLGFQEGQSSAAVNNGLSSTEGVSVHYFNGPHPVGNVGIQIHHVDPIQKDELVWTIHPQDVIIIGRLFNEGRYRAERLIALTGSGIPDTQYYNVFSGQHIGTILDAEHVWQGNNRIIEGNVLHGKIVPDNAHFSFYTNQITVLPEGDTPEFLGWLLPGFKKLSLSRTFFSWLAKNRTYQLDTNTHGEERPFVMTGQYEKVLPMNILPVYLLKAILAKDVERMEQLGIYEVAEEDFALCEFVCTSKIEVQKIISEGLELMRKES